MRPKVSNGDILKSGGKLELAVMSFPISEPCLINNGLEKLASSSCRQLTEPLGRIGPCIDASIQQSMALGDQSDRGVGVAAATSSVTRNKGQPCGGGQSEYPSIGVSP